MPSIDNSVQPHLTLKLNGSPAAQELLDNVLEVVVDDQVRLPTMFTLRVLDEALTWIDSEQLAIGKTVTISMSMPGQGQRPRQEGVLAEGEITALEPHFEENGPSVLVVRGYDKIHRLHRGRQTRSFLDMTDADIVKKVAGDAGLGVQADATSITHKYVLQNNQTDMEFLQARAARHGYQLYVEAGKLYFVKSDNTRGAGPELKRGETLISFQPRLSAARQADKVEVRGWDPTGKKPIVANATPAAAPHQGGVNGSGGALVKKAFGAATAVITGRPVATADEAQARAKAEAQSLSAEFLKAEGMCLGDPRVRAGRTLTIKGVGQRFSGQYYVTAATHVVRMGGEYTTTFQMMGQEPYTFSQLAAPAAVEAPREAGVVVGLVTSLKDPEKLGRVKVKFPWLGDNVESYWARVAVPSAGPERGIAYLPEVNDEVLVAFEHGDFHRPYVLGGLWNSQDKPPEADKLLDGDKVVQRVIKSRSGHLIVLDDTDGSEQIIIRDKTGENEIVIDSSNKALKVKIGGDVTLEAQGAITVKSTSKDITLDGNNLTFKAKQNVSVEANSNIDLKATAQCTVQGTAGVTVKNAAAQVALSGPSVNINNGALEVI